jgi:hypothetical protein
MFHTTCTCSAQQLDLVGCECLASYTVAERNKYAALDRARPRFKVVGCVVNEDEGRASWFTIGFYNTLAGAKARRRHADCGDYDGLDIHALQFVAADGPVYARYQEPETFITNLDDMPFDPGEKGDSHDPH